MVQVSLSDKEAVLFREFMEYHDAIDSLLQAGVFKIRAGKAVLHFDENSVLMEIEVNHKVFRKGKLTIVV